MSFTIYDLLLIISPCLRVDLKKQSQFISFGVLLWSPYGRRAAYYEKEFEKTKPMLK